MVNLHSCHKFHRETSSLGIITNRTNRNSNFTLLCLYFLVHILGKCKTGATGPDTLYIMPVDMMEKRVGVRGPINENFPAHDIRDVRVFVCYGWRKLIFIRVQSLLQMEQIVFSARSSFVCV